MIRRPQSFFVALTFLAMVALFYFPIWTQKGPILQHTLYIWGIRQIEAADKVTQTLFFPYNLMSFLTFFIVLLAGYALTQHNHTLKQLQVGATKLILIVFLITCVIYNTIQEEYQLVEGITGHYRLGFFLPAVAIISNVLANRFIQQDEKKKQSADRVR